jgi:hypothetical protein
MPNPLYELLFSSQKVISARIKKILSCSPPEKDGALLILCFRKNSGVPQKLFRSTAESHSKKGFLDKK